MKHGSQPSHIILVTIHPIGHRLPEFTFFGSGFTSFY